jgi:hypothetical protein
MQRLGAATGYQVEVRHILIRHQVESTGPEGSFLRGVRVVF